MQQPIRIHAPAHPQLFVDAIPGHFASSHAHLNYFIDTSQIKHNMRLARETAYSLATRFTSVGIDTILCIEETAFIGAFLARALSDDHLASMNAGANLYLIEPESNLNGQFVFADNIRHTIEHRNVLLLVQSASTGQTLKKLRECVEYYGGRAVGYACIFASLSELDGLPVVSLFTADSFPHYQVYPPHVCPMCAAGSPLDAIIMPGGYKQL